MEYLSPTKRTLIVALNLDFVSLLPNYCCQQNMKRKKPQGLIVNVFHGSIIVSNVNGNIRSSKVMSLESMGNGSTILYSL